MNKTHTHTYIYIYIYVCVCVCVCVRGVNINALTHAINQKMLMHSFVFMQINSVIWFEPNFLPSSQR